MKAFQELLMDSKKLRKGQDYKAKVYAKNHQFVGQKGEDGEAEPLYSWLKIRGKDSAIKQKMKEKLISIVSNVIKFVKKCSGEKISRISF